MGNFIKRWFYPVNDWLFEYMANCGFILFGGGKGDAPAPPDYTQLAAASAHAADVGKQLGEEQLAQNQKQYDQNMAVAQPIIQAQTSQMNQQAAQSSDYFNYMLQNSRPVEQQLLYNAMGLTPDEIAQVEASRSGELATQADQAKQAAAAAVPSFISVPTSSIKTNLPDGAVKGSDLGTKQVLTSKGGITQGPMSGILSGINTTYAQPTHAAVDPNAYYVKNADGTYKTVNPSYETVNGTQQVQVPGSAPSAAASGITDTPETNALMAKLSANAAIRQQNEAADTAIADSRKGATDAQNMAVRQGLRYGFSADKIAAAQAGVETQQAQQQAAAAYGARTQTQATRVANLQNVDSLYKGLPAASNAAANTSINAGNSAAGNQMAPSNAYMGNMTAANGLTMQGQQLNINGLSSILNAQTSAYNSYNNSGGDGGFGVLGTIAGAGINAYAKMHTP